MKKFINKLKNIEKEKIVIIILVILSMFPLYYPGFIYTHDGIIHLFRTMGEYENIVNFDFGNKIYYNMINGFGYGWGIFYPQLSAIIPALFMVLGFSLFTAQKLFIILAGVLAGIFSYKLFKELIKNNFCAMLMSILYILAPYKINQIIIRGAMGEILLFTFLPLVILGIIKILNKEFKYKYLLILGAVGIAYSHIISLVYTVIFAFIFLIVNYKKLFNKKVILEFLKCAIIIFFIILPVISPIADHQMTNLYNVNDMTIVDVADRIVHPGQLIVGSIEGKKIESTGYFSNDKEMNYMIGLTAILILSLFPFAYKKIKENNEIKEFGKYFIMLLISIVMLTVPFIWNKIELLDVIQFPFRILTFSVLFITIISGYVIKALINKENKYSLFLLITFFSFIFVFFIGIKTEFAKTLNQEFNFKNQEILTIEDAGKMKFSLGYSYEYLPKSTTEAVIASRGNSILSEQDIVINSQEIINNKLNARLTTLNQNSIIELPYIYYKGYSIKLDGKSIKYNISKNGFIEIIIPNNGEHEINLKYTGTILYNICNFIAIITACLVIIYVYKYYYKK